MCSMKSQSKIESENLIGSILITALFINEYRIWTSNVYLNMNGDIFELTKIFYFFGI